MNQEGTTGLVANREGTIGEGPLEQEPESHVLEASEEEDQRKALLEERIQEQAEREAQTGSPSTMIAEARKYIGYRESGDNDTQFNRWLGRLKDYPHGGYGYAWCHSFVSYCFWHSQNANVGPRTAGCKVGVAWFMSRNRYYSRPKVGDLVYYGPGGGRHVELVTSVSERTIRTIGGNTSGSLKGNYYNGDGVYEKAVNRSGSDIHGYGRPAYGGGGAVPITSIRTVGEQQEAVNGLGYSPALIVDGEWGPLTEAGVRWLQAKVGTTVDGQWGKDTEAAYAAYTAAGQSPGDTGSTDPRPGDTGGTLSMLRLGDRGAEVRELQEKLNGHGAGLDPDGDFGPATDRAVRKFQRATNLDVDGIVGPATWDRLNGEKLAEWPPAGRPDVPYIEEIRQAAKETGLPLRHALALVQGESDFKNIFGCDLGRRSTVPFCRQLVTRERFRALLNHVRKRGTSNGVGLTQVTYGGYLPQLEDAGGGEQPLAQCRVGFRILKDLFDRVGERRGYAEYNGGPKPPAVSWLYADAMLARARRWRDEGY